MRRSVPVPPAAVDATSPLSASLRCCLVASRSSSIVQGYDGVEVMHSLVHSNRGLFS